MTEIVLIFVTRQLIGAATYYDLREAMDITAHGVSSFSKRPQVFRSSGADDGQSAD